jgi:RNA methyltransferase, TrmH family
MIAIRKLMTLSPLHRARKAAQSLGHIEADWRLGDYAAAPWVTELAAAFAADTTLPEELRSLAKEVTAGMPAAAADGGASTPETGVRLVNRLARALEAHAGLSPADWDFREPLGVALVAGVRRVYPGVRAYLEDIRSPFNVGSIFRSADAFGVSGLLVSGFTADPAHPRAVRSAMGATGVVPWRRAGIEALSGNGETFALELRGEPVDTFEFPVQGIVVVGSEELGVSPEALARCGRTVSIPMLGAKGSLNVGVAFGILMDAWRRSLASRGIQPSKHGSV